MNNEQSAAATQSAGTIASPEFTQRMLAYDAALPGTDAAEAYKDVVGYIMDWHSAGVAAEKRDFGLLKLAYVQLQARLASCETSLAAAREQALEEVKAACANVEAEADAYAENGESMGAHRCIKAIEALASQPATTRQADELSVDCDAPLRGAPAATDSARLDWLAAAMSSNHESTPYFQDGRFGFPYLVHGSPMGGGVGFHGFDSLREAIDAASTDGGSRFRAEGGNTNQPEPAAAAAPVAQAPVVQDEPKQVAWLFENYHGERGTSLLEHVPRGVRNKWPLGIVNFAPVAAPTQVAPVLTDAIQAEIERHEAKLADDSDIHKACSGQIVSTLRAVLATPPALPVARLPDMDRLHSAIMNLPSLPRGGYISCPTSYGMGHRDARHAAAELVAATQAERQPQPAACHHHFVMDEEAPRYACCQLCGEIRQQAGKDGA